MAREKKDIPSEIEISFGYVFETVIADKTVKSVIVDVGIGRQSCSANEVYEEDGELHIVPVGGTANAEEIHKMLDEKLSLEQIVEGMNNFLKSRSMGVLPETTIQILTELSKQPTNVIRDFGNFRFLNE